MKFKYVAVMFGVSAACIFTSTPAEPQNAKLIPTFIVTPNGEVNVLKFEEAAWLHLTKKDKEFTNITNKSAWINPGNSSAPVAIIYSQGVGKWNWTVCLNARMEVVGEKK